MKRRGNDASRARADLGVVDAVDIARGDGRRERDGASSASLASRDTLLAMKTTIVGFLGVLVAACGGAPAAPPATEPTPGQLVTGATGCAGTSAFSQMMTGEEVAKLTGGCKEAKASTSATETLTSNTDGTCQAALTATTQTCIEPYPGTPRKFGVWADKKKSADCYCAQ
jgi:hypothetical protein